jgi:hypothetical protein
MSRDIVADVSRHHKVEVAGIEPASSGFLVGLLRAQPVVNCRGRRSYRRQRRPVSDFSFPERLIGEAVRVSPT